MKNQKQGLVNLKNSKVLDDVATEVFAEAEFNLMKFKQGVKSNKI